MRSIAGSAAERILGAILLLCALPLLLLAAFAIVLEDGFPVLFIQQRVGRNGRRFRLYKLRSMRRNASGTMQITASGDPRVTRAGRILRKYKIDELPQLWNVVKGDMNLIGPRPEVPRYVVAEDALWISVLQYRPGVTDLATLLFRDEERVLAAAADPESYYREVILPEKLRLAYEYQKVRTWMTDVKLLAITVWYSFSPSGYAPEKIRRLFLRDEPGPVFVSVQGRQQTACAAGEKIQT